MKVRDATLSDKAILLRFDVAIQDAECAVHDSRMPGEQVAESYYRKLLDYKALILLAEAEDQAVGFMAGWPELDDDEMQKLEWRRHALISDIYVTLELRGKGLGQQLLQAMSDRLQQCGVARLPICAVATNKATIAAYGRFGFQPFEVAFDKLLTEKDSDFPISSD